MKNGPRKEPYGSMVAVGLLIGIASLFLFMSSHPGLTTAIVAGAAVLVATGVWGLRKRYLNR